MSINDLFKKSIASREQVKLMLGLTGVSGAGKTYSALQLAYGITGDWSKIALADTENKSALYYAGDRTGPWQHIDYPSTMVIQGHKGYHPDNWVALIEEVSKDPNIEVLILDSISHEWQGTGGCLEQVEAIGKGFAGWKQITPRHNRFIDKMRESRLHIIATMRSVLDYVVEQNERGKSAPKKVGLKSNQREGTDYEFGIIFDIDISHLSHASKDRTGLYSERGSFYITPDTGKELLAWAKSGVEVKKKEPEIFDKENPAHVERLTKQFHDMPEAVVAMIRDNMHGRPITKLSLEEAIRHSHDSEVATG